MSTFDPTTAEFDQLEAVFAHELDVETLVQIQREETRRDDEPELAAADSAAPIDAGGGGRSEEAAASRAAVRVPPVPILRLRPVSGRYVGRTAAWLIELRVDVDGTRPTRKVSADYFSTAGGTTTYFGSMIVDGPLVTLRPGQVVLTGVGRFSWSAAAPRVRLAIPRVSVLAPPPPATLQHLSLAGVPGATYLCSYVSRFFRTVDLEQDRVATVAAPFVTYDTSLLPSGGPNRVLSVPAAYGEAGVEVRLAGVSDVVPPSEYNGTWSDAELHASMERHFSLWRDVPQWKVWLLHADLHDIGPNLLGIMFDQAGRQRQGAATFYRSLAGTTPDRLRNQLYTCVHEIGHCFNLFHSFHKQYMTPPRPNRLSSLSWMNYPGRFPGGEAAFWTAFPFQFDLDEVIHLRHAFRSDVIMGGNPFGIGSALEDPAAFADPVENRTLLRLELSPPTDRPNARFALGEPVQITLRLSAVAGEPRVNSYLHPSMGFVHIGIAAPGGQVKLYRPPITHCVADELTTIDASRPLEEQAYIGYGKDGHYFEHPGIYRLRAEYTAPDGTRVLSNVLTLRVAAPLSASDETAADLLLGAEQGMLLLLRGSDSETLTRGNDALERLLEEHRDHAATAYVRVVKAENRTRRFKTILPDAQMHVRPPDGAAALRYLEPLAAEATVHADVHKRAAVLQAFSAALAERGDERRRDAVHRELESLYAQRAMPAQVVAALTRAASEAAAGSTPPPRDVGRRGLTSYSWSHPRTGP